MGNRPFGCTRFVPGQLARCRSRLVVRQPAKPAWQTLTEVEPGISNLLPSFVVAGPAISEEHSTLCRPRKAAGPDGLTLRKAPLPWKCRRDGMSVEAPTVLDTVMFEQWWTLWSPDGKINLRYGDVWFVESYAVPDQYHREGEQQDLGALGKGIYAAYRTGQQFAEIYARKTFSGVCGSLAPQRTGEPARTGRFGASPTRRCSLQRRSHFSMRQRKAQGCICNRHNHIHTSQPFADGPPTTGMDTRACQLSR